MVFFPFLAQLFNSLYFFIFYFLCMVFIFLLFYFFSILFFMNETTKAKIPREYLTIDWMDWIIIMFFYCFFEQIISKDLVIRWRAVCDLVWIKGRYNFIIIITLMFLIQIFRTNVFESWKLEQIIEKVFVATVKLYFDTIILLERRSMGILKWWWFFYFIYIIRS